ncbi:Nin one binding Zn-ribbon like-domain-containing protein [Phycomyces blakesleeanus]|uniref:20S-pre-rRNA D-site endonuclease NOB1 n=1 Tax=Phycomyces blakesleeanus TaxID=4837 RepID=A0ABR3B8Q4_PHYBL
MAAIDQPTKNTADHFGSEEPKIKTLVIDTNAIINGISLRNLAEEFYTCPEVMVEIRSSHSRDFLTRLPFEIQIEQPSEESMKAVVEFSKKTGDYASLSIPDIKVLALAHTFAMKAPGHEEIRSEPLKTRPAGSLPSAPPPPPTKKQLNAEPEPEADDDGWEIATSKKKGPAKKGPTPKKTNTPAAPQPVKKETDEPVKEKTNESAKEEVKESVKEEDPVEYLVQSVDDIIIDENIDEDDSDAGDWITPENVGEFQAAQLGVTPEEMRKPKKMEVACVTSDFAMQNVLLQMNMNLVSAGGHRIKKVRNWVLRCHACFTVTTDMEKKFCPKCGNASLMRVSCSTNNKGQIVYYLKRNYNYNLRGTKYDIPNPKGGRQVNNLVLREDQNEYVKATRGHQKKKLVDLFDPDFTPIYGKMETRTPGNNMYGTDVIGFGRKNPNATNKRTGRKK